MTKQTIIPAGYRLTVKSWENDSDNHNTVVKEGLSKAECAFYVDLCKLLEHSTDYDNRICNLYEPGEKQLQRVRIALQEVARRHPKSATQLDDVEDGELTQDQMIDVLYELGLSCGEFYTRVCSDWKVEHVPVDVVLTDVTKDFK